MPELCCLEGEITTVKPQPQRIVYVTCFLDASGVSKLNFDVLRFLQGQGYTIYIVTTAKNESHFTWEYLFRNQFHHVYDLSEFPPEQRLGQFIRWMAEWNASLLFTTHSDWLYRHASAIKRFVPAIAIVDAIHTREPYVPRGGYPDISSSPTINPAIDSTIVISEDLRRYVLENYNVDPKKMVLIRNGIDINKYSLSSEKRQAFRGELGIDAARPLVGFIGRLSHQKRPLLFLEIAEKLIAHRPDVYFYMIGSGALADQVNRRLISSTIRSGSLVRFGRRDDIAQILRGTDLLLVPSIYEGAPLTIMEALASGVAVVASDVGAIREYFEGLAHLIEVGGQEVDEFVKCSLELLNKERRSSDTRSFNERFDMQRMAESYRHVFDGAVLQASGSQEICAKRTGGKAV